MSNESAGFELDRMKPGDRPRTRHGWIVKRWPLVLITVVLLTHPVVTLADWTVAMPVAPGTSGLWVTPANKYGVAVVLRAVDSETTNTLVVWYSPRGELVLSYSFSETEFRLGESGVNILNSRQVLLRESDRRYRLLSLDIDGNYAVKDYVLSSSQSTDLFLKDRIESDLSGFYYTDSVTRTLTRVDFPKPTPSSNTATLRLQSADEIAGPWHRLGEIEVTTEKPVEFIKIEIVK